jgi:hypothetical protein
MPGKYLFPYIKLTKLHGRFYIVKEISFRRKCSPKCLALGLFKVISYTQLNILSFTFSEHLMKKRIEVCYIYTHEHSIATNKHCLKKGDGNIMEGVTLLKVHCIHVWNYHNEIPSCY